jgi:acetyltransferase-like isoleucine patch superfamily enzyme
MLFIKIYLHIASIIKILLYKCLFYSKLKFYGNCTFRKGFTLWVEGSGKIFIGKNCFFNNYCSIVSRNSITIGDGTLFGENVKVYDHNHCFKDYTTPIKGQGYTSAPIKIGNHCWIASNVVILKGVTIGDNCVIGAGCIIHKDVPPNSIVINKQNHLIQNKLR